MNFKRPYLETGRSTWKVEENNLQFFFGSGCRSVVPQISTVHFCPYSAVFCPFLVVRDVPFCSTDARLVLTKSPRVHKCVHYIWSLRLIKNCPHICNLSIFCPLGKAAWAARSVDSGHNFYYPFTYTFAIIILFNVPHPKKVKSWRQKRWI